MVLGKVLLQGNACKQCMHIAIEKREEMNLSYGLGHIFNTMVCDLVVAKQGVFRL